MKRAPLSLYKCYRALKLLVHIQMLDIVAEKLGEVALLPFGYPNNEKMIFFDMISSKDFGIYI